MEITPDIVTEMAKKVCQAVGLLSEDDLDQVTRALFEVLSPLGQELYTRPTLCQNCTREVGQREITPFATAMRTVRDTAQLTQKQVAGALDLSESSIVEWENSQSLPDWGMVAAVLACYRVDAATERRISVLYGDAVDHKKARTTPR